MTRAAHLFTRWRERHTQRMSSSKDKQLFFLAKEFAEVFESNQFRPIPLRQLTQAYQSKHKKNFSPRRVGYHGIEKFVKALPIFCLAEGLPAATFNRAGFIEFFFGPVLNTCGGTASSEQLVQNFEPCTGVKIDSICDILQLNSIEELIHELMSNSERFELVQSASTSRESVVRFRHHPTGRGAGIKTAQEETPSHQNVPRIPHVEAMPNRSGSEDFLSLTTGNRALLPSPPHVMRDSGPSMNVYGHSPHSPLNPPSPYDPHIEPVSTVPPRQMGSASSIPPSHHHFWGVPVPQQAANVPSTRPPYHHHHGVPGSLSAPRQVIRAPSALHGRDISPISGPPSPHGIPIDINSRMPLSPCSIPRISPGPSPDLGTGPGPGPQITAYVLPQVISTHQVPGAARQPSPHPMLPTDPAHKFPYPDKELSQETILPSHSKFRPDLPVPRVSSSTTDLPKSKKKRSGYESRQRVIDQLNEKVEELINDLSSQGKFLHPDIVRSLVLDMLNKANQGRSYQEKVVLRDVSALADYSKVHGRIEELIKVFCWYSPVTSLYELEQALIQSEKVDSYEALRLGPIVKHPKVIDLFKLQEAATLDTVPEMSSYKIHTHLMKFLTRKRQKEGKYSVVDFLEYIREKEFAESVYHLCIRITSFPLAIQVMRLLPDWE